MKNLKPIYFFIAILIPSYFYSQNIDISQGNVFDGEPYIAINPYNSQHIVIAWMGFKFTQKIVIKTKVSFDGGNSWSKTSTLKHANPLFTSADPSIDFSPNEDVFISFVDFTGVNTDPVEGGIYLAKSIDGGLNWNNPVLVLNINADPEKKCIDRPWLSIDRSEGNTNGNIYITSMNANGATSPYHPYISISVDGGKSFNWKYLDNSNWLSGNSIPQPMPSNTVSNNGILYAVYPSYVFTQSILPQYILAKSKDGGNNFTYNSVFKNSSSINDIYAKKGYLIRTDPLDNKHIIFLYLKNNESNIDVACSESFDGGESWRHIDKINDDQSPALQDLVWGAFNEKGDYIATWRDRRKSMNDSYINPFEIYASIKYKDSLYFSKNFRISDTLLQFDDIYLQSGNDFMSSAYVQDTLYAVWGDTRNGKLNIWFQKMNVKKNFVSLKKIINKEKSEILVYPNPSVNSVLIKGKNILEISIIDIKGRLILSKIFDMPVNEYYLNQFTKGYYFILIKTKNKIYKKPLIQH